MDNTPIVLAYSGGLDTSFCIPWIKENYSKDVITLTVDTGVYDEDDGDTYAMADITANGIADTVQLKKGAWEETGDRKSVV